MDPKIIWTERASADIEAIVRYISRRDPQAAARRWKIVYTIRGDAIIIGRVWPAAMGEADLETPL